MQLSGEAEQAKRSLDESAWTAGLTMSHSIGRV